MLVADVDPHLLRGGATAFGLVLGAVASKMADLLPRRYGVHHVPAPEARSRRNAALLVLAASCALGIAQILTTRPELPVPHALLLLATNALVATSVLAAAAIDFEHMILPNELTLGPLVLCLVTSPVRSIGFVGALSGTVVGLLASYLPVVLYRRLRGRSGMGIGDVKLAALAGAWHGPFGALVVLFAGALQSALVGAGMRLAGRRYATPASVTAELAELERRAATGDAEATRVLAHDPMAGGTDAGMRLPLGPFLALSCIEVLFLRRWLVDQAFGWLMR